MAFEVNTPGPARVKVRSPFVVALMSCSSEIVQTPALLSYMVTPEVLSDAAFALVYSATELSNLSLRT